MHNGKEAYPGAVECINKLQEQGKQIVSNALCSRYVVMQCFFDGDESDSKTVTTVETVAAGSMEE